MIKPALVAIVISLMVNVCGYHTAGQGTSLPENIKTIAVPIFKNSSLKYRVEQRFTRAVIDEILKRSRRLNVTTDPEAADAVLTGDIVNFRTYGALLDEQGRVRVYTVTIVASVTLRDMKTRRVLYSNPSMSFEGEYQLSDDPQSFFNEENPAVDRIARDFSRTVVTTIMEGL